MEPARVESAEVDRPGHAPRPVDASTPSDSSEPEGPQVWVVVDRRQGPDGGELSTPVAAFTDVREGLRFITESPHPMLLVPVPLVASGWKNARALGPEPEST